MDNSVVTHQLERHQHLACEAPDQCRRESYEAVGLDELV